MFVKSEQNRSPSGEIHCTCPWQIISTKLAVSYWSFFSKFVRKFPRTSHEISHLFHEYVSENSVKSDFFSASYQKPWLVCLQLVGTSKPNFVWLISLWHQQAGFRPDRSYINQITTLRIIVEQSTEWNSPLYVNFVDYEKAFDSPDRESLWKLLCHYGVPMKFVNLTRNSYEGLSCRVVHEGRLTETFEVKTGVRQGCLLSPFLFILATDWIMRAATNRKRTGIQWTLWTQLDGLDIADDLALLSHNLQQMQAKTWPASHVSANRTDDQQAEDKDPEDQCRYWWASHNWRGRTGGQKWGNGCRCKN